MTFNMEWLVCSFMTLFSILICECHNGLEDNDDWKIPNVDDLLRLPGHLDYFGSGRPVHDIDEIDGYPTTKQFYDEYVMKSKPLKMKAAAKSSPAYQLWKTDGYFLNLELPADEMVLVETKKKENRTQKTLEMHFKDFVKSYNGSENYMVQTVPKFLGKDIPLPRPLQCEQVYQEVIIEMIMWFSSGGTKSVVHTDSVDNLNCVFQGTKKFYMVDPEQYGDLVDFDHPEGAYSDIDVDKVDYTKYPGMSEVEFHNVELEAGDCLFIPYKWIHQVRSFDRNIAVNIWWDHFKNELVDLGQCPDKDLDNLLTLDQVPMQGFDSLSQTYDAMRDHFITFLKRKPVTFEELLTILLGGDAAPIEERGYGVGFKLPIRQIFTILDKNEDSLVSLNEVKDITDPEWDAIQIEMNKFESVMDELDKHFMEDDEVPPEEIEQYQRERAEL